MNDIPRQIRLVREGICAAYDEIEQSDSEKVDNHIYAALATILGAMTRLTHLAEVITTTPNRKPDHGQPSGAAVSVPAANQA